MISIYLTKKNKLFDFSRLSSLSFAQVIIKEMNNKALGQIVNEARKAQRLSQMDLQDLSGVSASVIYKIEKGRNDIAFGSLLAVADALGIKLKAKSPLGQEVRLNG